MLDAAKPAFANLNAAFPPVRAFAREALPGVRSTPATLDAATPLLEQVRLLSQPSELRGLANDLRPGGARARQPLDGRRRRSSSRPARSRAASTR